MLAYGARDVYMGLAVFAATYYNHVQALGWIMIAGSAVAFADGAICRNVIGHGDGVHWISAPILTAFGVVCLGVLDSQLYPH